MTDTPSLSGAAAAALLRLARESIATAFEGKAIPPCPDPYPALLEPRGAFVTLKQRGRLRGCIGRVESERALWETVARVARSSAFEDPRFKPLAREELDTVTLEVSVMSPLRPVASPEEVVAGRHGVMIELHGRRALFLPQVASEQGWERTTLLQELCAKAGLPPDAYSDPEAVLKVFEAEVIGD